MFELYILRAEQVDLACSVMDIERGRVITLTKTNSMHSYGMYWYAHCWVEAVTKLAVGEAGISFTTIAKIRPKKKDARKTKVFCIEECGAL